MVGRGRKREGFKTVIVISKLLNLGLNLGISIETELNFEADTRVVLDRGSSFRNDYLVL